MRSWKTSVFGAITAAGMGFSQSEDPTLKMIGQVLIVIGPILLGVFAKDSNVTGGKDAIPTDTKPAG
jgi:hypothetical protein